MFILIHRFFQFISGLKIILYLNVIIYLRKKSLNKMWLLIILTLYLSIQYLSIQSIAQTVLNKLDTCVPNNKKAQPFYIKKINSKARFKFYNNSSCTILVPTSTFLRSKNRMRLELIPNGANFKLNYFIDSKWEWGDAILLYPLLPRRHFVFSIPVSRIVDAKKIEIPIQSLGDENSILSENVRRIQFSLMNSTSKLSKRHKKVLPR